MITVILYLQRIGWFKKCEQEEKALHGNAGQPNIEKSETNQNLQKKDEPYDTRDRK